MTPSGEICFSWALFISVSFTKHWSWSSKHAALTYPLSIACNIERGKSTSKSIAHCKGLETKCSEKICVTWWNIGCTEGIHYKTGHNPHC
jgi:hypothetical protein